MITIKNSKPTKQGKKQFQVDYTGDNNEPLSEARKLNTKQACYKNIAAMYKNFPQVAEAWVEVRDLTGKKPQLFAFNIASGKKEKKAA